jgi:hypothetical protein
VFHNCRDIPFLGQVNIGGIKFLEALTAHTTVTFFAPSLEVAASTYFCPLGRKIHPGFYSVEMYLPSTL